MQAQFFRKSVGIIGLDGIYMRAILARMQLDAEIRREIRKSDKTRYQLSKESGIDQSVLSRFVKKRTPLSRDNLDRLLPVLGLELKLVRRKK